METEIFIHETAVVDQPCHIGSGSKIWHFSHLMPHCFLGENCVVGQNVYVASTVRIGNNVKIQNNVSLYDGVVCEDDVFIGPSAVFTNVVNPRSFVCRKNEYAPTLVKKGATIGANATIVCGKQIGRYAFVAAGSVVTHDVPDYALVAGNPAKAMGWMSEKACKLEFNAEGIAVCTESGEKYKLIDNQVVKL